MNIYTTDQRIESKFITNNFGLNNFLRLFRNNGFLRIYPDRFVNSLYYDNLQYSSIKDNLTGITPRIKFRLRWYGNKNIERNNYQFEKKIKLNITGYKQIIKFPNNMDLLSMDYSIAGLQKITKIYDPNFFPLNYKPQLLCCYARQYFENSYSARLTIDSNIKFCSLKNDLSQPSLMSNYNIVEIKFKSKHKDLLLPLFRKLPTASTRCSKYLIGHAKINRVKYI